MTDEANNIATNFSLCDRQYVFYCREVTTVITTGCCQEPGRDDALGVQGERAHRRGAADPHAGGEEAEEAAREARGAEPGAQRREGDERHGHQGEGQRDQATEATHQRGAWRFAYIHGILGNFCRCQKYECANTDIL